MNLSKIRKIVGGLLVRIVTDSDGTQWMGNGQAFYKVDSALTITEENAAIILEVPEDKRKKMSVAEINGKRLTQFSEYPGPGDTELRFVMTVFWRGEPVNILMTKDGRAAIVPQAQIAAAELKDAPTMLALREIVNPDTGEVRTPCVAVFGNMLCNALLIPYAWAEAEAIWQAMRDASAESLRYVDSAPQVPMVDEEEGGECD